MCKIKKSKIECSGKTILANLNLYGDKQKENIDEAYFISSKRIPGLEVLKEWGVYEIPLDLNVLHSNEGNGLFLYDSNNFESFKLSPKEKVSFRIQLSEVERLKYYISRVPALFK